MLYKLEVSSTRFPLYWSINQSNFEVAY